MLHINEKNNKSRREKNKMNKGQTTLFVIIGIVLTLAFIFLFIFYVNGETTISSTETYNANSMIESCLRNSALNTLSFSARQGNRINIPNILEVQDTSYWIYQYGNIMPVLNSTIDEIKKLMEFDFERCIDFSSLGYEASFGELNSDIDFSGEEVVVVLNFPVNLTRGEETIRIKNFQQTLNIRYRRMFELGKRIVEAHYDSSFDYRQPLENVDKKNFNVEFEVLDENNIIFTIIDKQNLEGQEFRMKFVTNLNRTNLKRTANVDTDFFKNFVFYSPDRLAKLTLNKNVLTNSEKLSVTQDYSNVVSREVSTYKFAVNSRLLINDKSELKWYLNYPVYDFNPDDSEFYLNGRETNANLTIHWDDIKIPNSGPMGLLYKGERTDYEWRPIGGEVDYKNSNILMPIDGFSSYTALDCNKQSCKSASVSQKNQPDDDFWCDLGSLGHNAAEDSYGDFWSNYWSSNYVGLFTADLMGQGAAVTFYYILDSLDMMDYDDKEPNAITFVPTCDQKVEVYCFADRGVEKGNCFLDSASIVASQPGTKHTFNVKAGKQYVLQAWADRCVKEDGKCKSCQVHATLSYK